MGGKGGLLGNEEFSYRMPSALSGAKQFQVLAPLELAFLFSPYQALSGLAIIEPSYRVKNITSDNRGYTSAQ